MKQPKIGWVAGLLMFFLLFMMLSSMGQGTEQSENTFTSTGQNSQATAPGQGVANIPLDQQWKLVQFENLAINIDGQLYDKGTFQNQSTGEIVVARCITMDIADPNIGDVYTRSGDTFSPVGGGSQTFQTFEVVTTPTPTATAIATPTGETNENQGFKSEGNNKPLSFMDYLISFAVLIGLVVLFILGIRFLWRHA